jgi:hypothetical protein
MIGTSVMHSGSEKSTQNFGQNTSGGKTTLTFMEG